jgi:hypothetical protein
VTTEEREPISSEVVDLLWEALKRQTPGKDGDGGHIRA